MPCFKNKIPYSLFVKTFKTTCCLGGVAFQIALNLEKLGVEIHKCALILDFTVLFFVITPACPYFPEQALHIVRAFQAHEVLSSFMYWPYLLERTLSFYVWFHGPMCKRTVAAANQMREKGRISCDSLGRTKRGWSCSLLLQLLSKINPDINLKCFWVEQIC